MFKTPRLVPLVLAALVASPALAGSLPIYECDRTKMDLAGGISDKFYFEVDEKNNTARVLDYYTSNFSDGPVVVETFQNQEKRYRFKWTVRNVPTSDSGDVISRVQYTANLYKHTMKLRVDAILSQYDNSPWGEGTCKLQK